MEKIEFDPRLQAPFPMIVFRCSGSGKGQWVSRLCEQQTALLAPQAVQKILWYYGVSQPAFHSDLLKRCAVELHAGFVEQFYANSACLRDRNCPVLLVLDDLHAELANKPILGALFTKFSDHNNNSIIYTTQNFYHQGSQNRDVSRNAHYIAFLAQPRDGTVVRSIA